MKMLFVFAILNIVWVTCGSTHAKVIEGPGAGKPGEISRRMCEKYSKYVKSDECPFNPSSPLIDGEVFAGRKEFPHMVMLGYKVAGNIKWTCGGSLISEQYVLTTAQCLNNSFFGIPVVVKIGVTDLEDTNNLQEIKVEEINIHPLYKPPAIYNDIGLVRLEKKVDINEFARPACLNTRKDIDITKAITTGWGPTLADETFLDDNLQKYTLDLYAQEKCNDFYKSQVGSKFLPNGITYDIMLCAGSKLVPVLMPRSTGPLQIYHSTSGGANTCMYDIIGVDSVGKPGSGKDQPDIYTRVSPNIPWIEETVWSNE